VSVGALLPILVLASSAIPGVIIFTLGEGRERSRTVLNLSGAVLKLVFIAVMLHGVSRGQQFEFRYQLVGDFDLYLRADALAMLFVTLSAGLWLVTTIYAIGYFRNKHDRSRFFGFFSLCVSATTGIALAGNPITFLIFYEGLTLSTYPLVVHYGDRASLRVGRRYLAYTLTGGALLLVATVWAHALAGPFDFTTGGALRNVGEPALLIGLFALFIVALGIKTALVPLHGWLPAAMVAPAPVSALLHAVAVVKAGAFGIVRVIHGVFGFELSAALGLLVPLSIAASVTIVYGSLRALVQDDLKKRLAYSTVSQVAYIVLGVSLFGPLGTLGGLAHLVHQGIMKITMFFCAGSFDESLGVHRVSEMNGIGRRMPFTMGAFTVAALGMIGLPPLAGFISKWYLGMGALAAGSAWVIPVLLASTVLNAAYFLPILRAAWFEQRREPWPAETITGRRDASLWLLAPPLITAALTVLVGVLAASAYSVQSWAEIIVAREYLP
jgi:multicomponent Na+:H+ antiporter subunit D